MIIMEAFPSSTSESTPGAHLAAFFPEEIVIRRFRSRRPPGTAWASDTEAGQRATITSGTAVRREFELRGADPDCPLPVRFERCLQ